MGGKQVRVFNQRWNTSGTAREMKRIANTGTFYGQGLSPYLQRCTGDHQPTGTKLCFTRDVGHHASGWWKNPDYERCYHLSLSFYDPETGEASGDKDEALTKEWIGLFFGDWKRLLWAEPPSSEIGEKYCTWHYRLFFHPGWKEPLLPRKEVYTREFTEAGWLSFSDLQAVSRGGADAS